jgi:peptide/nickel transport system substrate-binding protein
MQFVLIVQSDRCYKQLNRLDKTFQIVSQTYQVPENDKIKRKPTKKNGCDQGDWLIWAFRVEPRTLNPISAEDNIYTEWITIPYIFEPLFVYDLDQIKLKPLLADSYELSGDGLEVTIRIRDDVHFSDGVAVTSDDVVFTYETIVDPKIDAANIANKCDIINRVTRIDEVTVKLFLKRPCFESLINLSFIWNIGVLPEHIYKYNDPFEFNNRISDPVGSGPFLFEKWDVGREIVLQRNENYWGQKPNLEKIIYRFISNPVACVQSLRSHQVDVMIPEPEQFAELADDEQFNKEFNSLWYWTPFTPFYYIGWNQNTIFFADRQIRLAMTHIINRKQIVSYLLQGYGQEISGPLDVLDKGGDIDIEHWPYDPQKAEQLLGFAGWQDIDGDGIRDKDGIAFSIRFLYSNSYTLYERLARLLKDEAAKVGIELIPVPCEWSILLARLNNRDFDCYIAGWSADKFFDPYELFHSSQIRNGGSNYVGFKNSEADAIIEKIRATTNDKQRYSLYNNLHKILHQEQPYTFLFTRPTFRFVDRRFKNVVIHKSGLDYLRWYVPESEQRYK